MCRLLIAVLLLGCGPRVYQPWNVLRLLRDRGARLAACDAVVLSIGGNDLCGDSIAREDDALGRV